MSSTYLPAWGQPDPFGKTPPTVARRPLVRSVVTESEALEAGALVSEWRTAAAVTAGQLTTSQLAQLRAYVAGALADARDGATVPGERLEVDAHASLPGHVWRQAKDRAGVEASARAWVRREWAAKLVRERLRPLTWPAVEVSFQQWNPLRYSASSGQAEPMVDCEEDEADQVTFTLRGLAVAL